MATPSPWSNAAAGDAGLWRVLEPLDAGVDRSWDPLRRSPPLNRLFLAASAAGEHGTLWISWGLVRIAGRLLGGNRDLARREGVRLYAALTLESLLVNGLVKGLTRRPRPTGERVEGVRVPVTSSFPSGHSTSSALAATLLSEGAPLPERVALVTTAALIATSRAHLRVHHPTDVAVGAAAGYLVARWIRGRWPLGSASPPADVAPPAPPDGPGSARRP